MSLNWGFLEQLARVNESLCLYKLLEPKALSAIGLYACM